MALNSRLRLVAALAACVAAPVLVGSVRSADDTTLAIAPGPLPTDSAPAQPFRPTASQQQLAAAEPGYAAIDPMADPALMAPPSPEEPLLAPPGPLADRTVAPVVHPDAKAIDRIVDLYRAGDLKGGDAVAAGLADPAAVTLAQWLAIRLLPREAGSARIEAFIARNPDWPTQAQLRRRVEEALLSEKPAPARLLAYFDRHPPQTAMGKLTRAKLWAERGRASQAAAAVRALWREEDFGSDIEDDVLDAFPRVITPADHMARSERFIAGEDWKDAQRNAARAGADYGKLAQARMAAARAAADMQAQLDAVPKALQSTPSFLFAKAQVLRRKDKAKEAAEVLRALPAGASGAVLPEEWWTERRVLARKLLDQREPALAYEVAAARPAGGAALTVEAEFHAGWIALRFLGDPAVASAHFATAARSATTPISVSRIAYWQARAAETRGLEATAFYEAAAVHGMTYYGQLARARLGRTDDFVLRRPEHPGDEPRALATAVRLLFAAQARDLAMPLIVDAAQRDRDPNTITALAHVVQEFGDVRAALALGKAATQRGLPLDTQAFPVGGLPVTALPPDGIEAALAFAIARQESAFDPKAQSTAGARGLMQLMPATARETASRAGMPFAIERLTADPAYNAALGAAHLGDLTSAWRGSYVLTIAAYNAGSGNVKKWVEAYGDPRDPGVDVIDWIERIPFSETRNYVQRVMENLQVYRSRLGSETALLIEQDLRRGAPR